MNKKCDKITCEARQKSTLLIKNAFDHRNWQLVSNWISKFHFVVYILHFNSLCNIHSKLSSELCTTQCMRNILRLNVKVAKKKILQLLFVHQNENATCNRGKSSWNIAKQSFYVVRILSAVAKERDDRKCWISKEDK